jgi:hypothetical protein
MTSFEVNYPKLEITNEDRIRLIKKGDPVAAPGECILCKGIVGVDGRTLIDFGKNIQLHGRVQFCNLCISPIARIIGFISLESKEYKKLIADYESIVILVTALENEVTRLREYESIVESFRNLGMLGSIITTSVDSNSETVGTSQGSEGDVSGGNKQTKSADSNRAGPSSTDVEYGNEQGPAIVRSFTDIDDISKFTNI